MIQRPDLLAISEEDLSAAGGSLTLKRAHKDLEREMTATLVFHETSDKNAPEIEVQWEDAICKFPPGGLHLSSCNCPARKMCSHRIRSILWLQRQETSETSAPTSESKQTPQDPEPSTSQPTSAPQEPVPTASKKPSEISTDSPFSPAATSSIAPSTESSASSGTEGENWTPASISQEQLKRTAGASLWKKAQRALAEGLSFARKDATSIEFPTLGVTVRYFPHLGIEAAICSCGSMQLCLHRVLGALAYHQEGANESEELHNDPKARASLDRLWSHVVHMLGVGLDSLPEETAEQFDATAQEVEDSFPAAASDMSALARLLRDYHARSARFQTETWLRVLARLGCRIQAMQQPLSSHREFALRGRSKRAPLAAQSMPLVGLGAEGFQSRTGLVIRSWFVHPQTGMIAFADLGWSQEAGARTLNSLWNGLPLWGEWSASALAHQTIQLLHPRISPDGKLGTAGNTNVSIKAPQEATWKALPSELVASNLEDLKRRWQTQIPVVLRSFANHSIPILLQIDPDTWPSLQPQYSEASQTLLLPLDLQNGGTVRLLVSYTQANRQCIEQLERIRNWPKRPTHIFVRIWPTAEGWTAMPISVWFEDEYLPSSLGLGELLVRTSHTPSHATITAGPHPEPPEDQAQTVFSQLNQEFEGMAMEGILRSSPWRSHALAQCVKQLHRLELSRAATGLEMWRQELQGAAHSKHQDKLISAFLSQVAWSLEIQESWWLRESSPTGQKNGTLFIHSSA